MKLVQNQNLRVTRLVALSVTCAFAILGQVACHKDGNQTKLQYMPDMADNPVVKAQRGYIDPPEGSVAFGANVIYPDTPEDSEKFLNNPFPASDAILASGKDLFTTYCAVCHGDDAKGGGTFVELYTRPPDLTAATYVARKDGFFFYRITFGGAIMPGYGHSTAPNERWHIVHYLRTLQKAGQ